MNMAAAAERGNSMKAARNLAVSLLCGGCLVAIVDPAAGADIGITNDGHAYVVGGVGEAEAVRLERARGDFALSVVTAASGSGAYLVGVRVRVIDEQSRLLLDQLLGGPWLLIDLPPGKHWVEATYRDHTQVKTTTIHAGDHHQMVFYFNGADDVASPPAALP